MWLALPWWMPYLYGFLLLLILAHNIRHRDVKSNKNANKGWLGKVLLSLLRVVTAFGFYVGFQTTVRNEYDHTRVGSIFDHHFRFGLGAFRTLNLLSGPDC